MPKNFLKDSFFCKIQDYTITKSTLFGKIISLKCGELYLISYPFQIYHETYFRKSLDFNVSIMVSHKLYKYLPHYSSFLKKIVDSLQLLERDQNYKEKLYDEKFIENIIEKIFIGINERKSPIHIKLDSNHVMHIGLFPINFKEKKSIACHQLKIEDHFCPIFYPLSSYGIEILSNSTLALPNSLQQPHKSKNIVKQSFVKSSFMTESISQPTSKDFHKPFHSLTIEKILPFINGANSLKKLSHLAAVNQQVLGQTLRILESLEIIKIIDLIQYSNVYIIRNEKGQFTKFARNQSKINECIQFSIDSKEFDQLLIQGGTKIQKHFSRGASKESVLSNQQSLIIHSSKKNNRLLSTKNAENVHLNESYGTKDSFLYSSSKLQVLDVDNDFAKQISIFKKVMTFKIVFLYGKLNEAMTVSEFIAQNDTKILNIKRFIAFGVINKFIRRLHPYGLTKNIYIKKGSINDLYSEGQKYSSQEFSAEYGVQKKKKIDSDDEEKIAEMMDGNHCFDQICVKFNITQEQLMEMFKHKIHTFYQ